MSVGLCCSHELHMIHLLILAIILNVFLIGLYSLRRLRLQDNLIQQLPEVLDDLEVLEQLSLRKNHLSFIPPKLLSNLKHLKYLDLTSNWISSVHVLIVKIYILG
jgi:Leucine-rich repeat (LRR) protein